MSNSRKQRQADQLGIPVGTARVKLQKNSLWRLLMRYGENVCQWCDTYISSPEDLTLTHIEPWLDVSPDLFWDLDNVAFMHPKCSSEHSDHIRQRKLEDQVDIVKVRILDDNNYQLPCVRHNGRIYVAGMSGRKYKIEVRNMTGQRVEITSTVDGLDVIGGKPGSIKRRGYVVAAFETFIIEGWRTSDQNVAAFKFGDDKENSYSAQMGSGANLGIIGIAAFREENSAVMDIQYHDPRSIRVMRSSTVQVTGVGPQFHDSISGKGFGSGFDSGFDSGKFSASVQPGLESLNDSGHFGSSEIREDVKLGTKFGESINAPVKNVSFVRRSQHPDQIITIEYDTMNNLNNKGILINSQPSPFPADDSGYCSPPSKR